MAIPHCGIGAAGSRAAACKKDRSASVAQKECICATPWLKNSCALALDVVMGKSMRPCPVRMRAGSDGAVPPGGGAHISLGLTSGTLLSAANRAIEDIKIEITRKRIWLAPNCSQAPLKSDH